MKSQKTQGFVKGAAILAAAGIAVKVIGACYKIPLGVILGPVGMANFSIAYNIYALLFVLSTAGVPAAVSKMVAEARARKNSAEEKRIYKVAQLSFAVVGFLGFALMFFGAEKLSRFMGSESSAASVRAISPAVLFVSVSAINRGYFQGCSDMYPTAISEIIEALGKLVFGISAAWMMKRAGFGDDVVSAGAVSGVSVGALFSAIFFLFRRGGEKAPSENKTVRGKRSIMKELISLAVPITAGAAVISLTNVIDSALVMNLLAKNGFDEYRAKWLYGAYNYAATLFNLPSALITTLSTALIPAVSGAFARRDCIHTDKTVNSALGIAMMIAVPAACGLGALSRGIVHLLYGAGIDYECVEVSARMLSLLSYAVPLLALVTVTNAVHQALGHQNFPVFSMMVGAIVKIVSNTALVSRPEINIYGACVSTVFCYASIAVLNIAALKKYPFVEMSISKIFIKPALAGAAVFGVARGVYNFAGGTFGSRISTILSVFAGIFACAVCAFCIGAVGKDEKKLVFGEKKISKFLNND